jgi:leader peptidase (prepilin peptidase)/N-methyltransferase
MDLILQHYEHLFENHIGILVFCSAVLGLLLGSFFNVVVIRVPLRQSISFPSSHCMHCKHKLSFLDLIPVFSYFFLRGKCKYCKVTFSSTYVINEAITGIIFGFLAWQLGWSSELLAGLFTASIFIIISISDLHYMLIPNKIVFFGIIGALVIRSFVHPLPLLNYVIAAFIGSGILFAIGLLSEWLLKKEGMGGGDIKLYVFVGLMLGVKLTMLSIFIASLLGSLIGISLISMRIRTREQVMPFGPFIALGAFFSYLCGDSIFSWYMGLLS